MNLASILREIDAEITKLQSIREIVQGLAGPGPRLSFQKPRRSRRAAAAVGPSTIPAPELVILPAKQKREYSPRVKPVQTVSRALGPAPSDRPVFVPRASLTTRVEQDLRPAVDHSLETVVRKNLLGGGPQRDIAAFS